MNLTEDVHRHDKVTDPNVLRSDGAAENRSDREVIHLVWTT